MAEPIRFPEANFVWKGWEADETRDEVLDLHSYKDESQTISCWKMTFKERLKVLFSGNVWLHVIGHQPPVAVTADLPFKRVNGREGGFVNPQMAEK